MEALRTFKLPPFVGLFGLTSDSTFISYGASTAHLLKATSHLKTNFFAVVLAQC